MKPGEEIAQQIRIATDKRNYVDRVAELNLRELRFNVACQMMAAMLANPSLANDTTYDDEFIIGENALVRLSYQIADKMIAAEENTRC